MKIAIPENQGEVNQHFGQSKTFAIIEIDQNNNVTAIQQVSTEGFQHRHEGLASILKEQNVETVIVGGIGPGAIRALESQGIKILFGASGPVREVAESFARGEFVSVRKVCNHHGGGHHHHHHDGGGCSH